MTSGSVVLPTRWASRSPPHRFGLSSLVAIPRCSRGDVVQRRQWQDQVACTRKMTQGRPNPWIVIPSKTKLVSAGKGPRSGVGVRPAWLRWSCSRQYTCSRQYMRGCIHLGRSVRGPHDSLQLWALEDQHRAHTNHHPSSTRAQVAPEMQETLMLGWAHWGLSPRALLQQL